jgi:hypothetical protein
VTTTLLSLMIPGESPFSSLSLSNSFVLVGNGLFLAFIVDRNRNFTGCFWSSSLDHNRKWGKIKFFKIWKIGPTEKDQIHVYRGNL